VSQRFKCEENTKTYLPEIMEQVAGCCKYGNKSLDFVNDGEFRAKQRKKAKNILN
jgi:hypothetical protein